MFNLYRICLNSRWGIGTDKIYILFSTAVQLLPILPIFVFRFFENSRKERAFFCRDKNVFVGLYFFRKWMIFLQIHINKLIKQLDKNISQPKQSNVSVVRFSLNYVVTNTRGPCKWSKSILLYDNPAKSPLYSGYVVSVVLETFSLYIFTANL